MLWASIIFPITPPVELEAAIRTGSSPSCCICRRICSYCSAEGGYGISHYRDNRKREIDFIVERKDGALLGVEVKAGQASTDDFRHLKWFAENIAKTPFTGIVLYSGNKTLRFGDGFYAVPLAALGA